MNATTAPTADQLAFAKADKDASHAAWAQAYKAGTVSDTRLQGLRNRRDTEARRYATLLCYARQARG